MMLPPVQLPPLDTHAIEIAAPPAAVWHALVGTMRRSLATLPAQIAARLTGVRERGFDGPEFPRSGTQVPGFRVAASIPRERLRLEGAHRFSQYVLDFELRPSTDGTRLSATTQAAFPGPAGAVYRALVIGTSAHVLVVRRMLRQVRRRAERAV